MKRKNHVIEAQASLPNLFDYNSEAKQAMNVEIISPEADIEECQGDSCAISMVFARRLKLMRNSKAA
jgi:hypothetical protein